MPNFTCPWNCPGCPPDPYHLPGYMGFVPTMKLRAGKTFGQLSNDIYQDPCVAHAPCSLIEPTPCMKFYACEGPCCKSEGIGTAPHCKPPRKFDMWNCGCPALPECRPRGPRCGPCGPPCYMCPPCGPDTNLSKTCMGQIFDCERSPNAPGDCCPCACGPCCPENPPNPKFHHINRSPYNCPCKGDPDASVYRCCEGMSPTYAGHVPGFTFHSLGRRVGKATWGTKQYMQDCFYYNAFNQT